MSSNCRCPTGTIHDKYDEKACSCVVKKVKLKPIMCWSGGKSRVAKKIIEKLPQHSTYVEPFAGGASVFFQKELVKINIINDKDKDLIDFYKEMKDITPEKMQQCRFVKRKYWDRIKEKRENGKKLSSCEYWQLVKASYGCTSLSYGRQKPKEGIQIGQNVEKKLIHYQEKLKNVKILNQDYKTVVKNYDSKDTCFYVDPPYPDGANYVHKNVDPKEVADVFKSAKGKVVISYNDKKNIRKAFPRSDGWHIRYLNVPYTLQRAEPGRSDIEKKELLITNF